jgi:hypothetical protein
LRSPDIKDDVGLFFAGNCPPRAESTHETFFTQGESMTPTLFRSVGGILTLASLALAPAACLAQDDTDDAQDPRLYSLVNIVTPELPTVRRGIYNFDIRAVGGKENKTYYGVGGVYSLRDNFALFGRVTFSDKRFYTLSALPIPTGGTEWEIGAKYRFRQQGDYQAAVQASLLYPNNARGSDPEFAGQLQVSRELGTRTTVYFVPKLLLGRRSVFTLGGGVAYRFNSDFAIFGDIQYPIGTDNTYNTNTGLRREQEVWGVGFRYSPQAFSNRISLDIGVTNGLGSTTGYSMTPALSGSAAFFVNLLYRL